MHLITDGVLLDIIEKLTRCGLHERPKRRKEIPKDTKEEYIVSYYFSDKADYITLIHYRETWLTIYSLANGESYIAKSMFAPELFQNGGTVLVGNINNGYFILSDIGLYRGRELHGLPFKERMAILNGVYSHDITRNPVIDPYVITVNDFQDKVTLSDEPCFKGSAGWLFQGRTAFVITQAPVNSIVKTKGQKPVLDTTKEQIFTVSYLDVDQYQLSLAEPYELAVIPDLNTSRYMRSLSSRLPLKMWCSYNPIIIGWVPTKVINKD